MAETMTDVLALTLDTLRPLFPQVHLAGMPDPAGEQVETVIVDRVANTGLPTYGERLTTKRLQVTCYAANPERALEMSDTVALALIEAGLRFIQSGPAPDPDYFGERVEFRA